MKPKTRKRIVVLVAIVLALMMVVPMLLSALTMSAGAVSQQEIDALKDNADDLSQQKKELNEKLDKLKNDRSEAIEKKELLDQQYDVIQKQISNVTARIKSYDTLIGQKEKELAAAEVKQQQQYELFCTRVRAMEENGTVSYWSILFKASNFSDLLGRLDFVSEVMEYDQGIISDLKATRQQITDDKTALESSRAEQVSAKQELADRQSELQDKVDEADALVKQIEGQTDEYNEMMDKLEAEENEVQAQIAQKIKELAAQNKPVVVGEGDYLWPVPASHRITSNFGYREHPTQGGNRFHYGIDISVPTGSNVLASKSGTVILSKYSSSYGNYIVISHGNGNTTLYAHLSKRLVEEGDNVKQGDVIAYSGSTGWSTGPHVHFEVSENGTRVDPESKF